MLPRERRRQFALEAETCKKTRHTTGPQGGSPDNERGAQTGDFCGRGERTGVPTAGYRFEGSNRTVDETSLLDTGKRAGARTADADALKQQRVSARASRLPGPILLGPIPVAKSVSAALASRTPGSGGTPVAQIKRALAVL